MRRLSLSTLLVDDNDLDCKKKEPTLNDIRVDALGFVISDLDKYDLIVYKGRLGTKVLRLRV